MAQKPKKFIMHVPDEAWLERVKEFRWQHRIPSIAEAIRVLVDKGLEAEAVPRKRKEPR